jgi:hypothetical protein
MTRRGDARLTPAQRMELRIGPAGRSSFRSDRRRRKMWELHADELHAEGPPRAPGFRLWGWWHYVAKRPEHLGEMPMMLDHPTLEEDAEAIDEYENEPIVWMAANGHLTRDEIAKIEAEARAASRRVGTDEERIGSAGADMADRRAVKLWGRWSGRSARDTERAMSQENVELLRRGIEVVNRGELKAILALADEVTNPNVELRAVGHWAHAVWTRDFPAGGVFR